MKEKLIIKSREQMDIISDPLALDIIHLLYEEEGATKEWIAEELGEELSIIEEYIERMLKTGFIVINKEKSTSEQKYYRMAARSFQTGKEILDEMNNAWVAGFINFQENKLIDFYDYLAGIEGDKEKHLEELGYSGQFWGDLSKVYLSKEEFESFLNHLKDFIKEKSSRERKQDDNLKEYNIFTFLFPNIKR